MRTWVCLAQANAFDRGTPAEGPGKDEPFPVHGIADMRPDEFEIAAEDQIARFTLESYGADEEIRDRWNGKRGCRHAREQHQFLDSKIVFQPNRVCVLLEQDATEISDDIASRALEACCNGGSNCGADARVQRLEARTDRRVGVERINAHRLKPKGFDKVIMSVFRCVCKPVY